MFFVHIVHLFGFINGHLKWHTVIFRLECFTRRRELGEHCQLANADWPTRKSLWSRCILLMVLNTVPACIASYETVQGTIKLIKLKRAQLGFNGTQFFGEINFNR